MPQSLSRRATNNTKNLIMRYISLLVILTYALSLSAQAPTRKVADKQFEMHAYQVALESYLELLKQEPESHKLHQKAGLCYYYTGKPAEAVKHFSTVLEQKNPDPLIHFYTGKALMMIGKYQTAIKSFVAYESTDPVIASHFIKMCNLASIMAEPDQRYSIEHAGFKSTQTELGIGIHGNKVHFNSFYSKIANPPSGWVSGDQYHYIFTGSTDANGRILKAELLKKAINITANEGPAAFAPDGKSVIFMRLHLNGNNRLLPETGLQSGLFMADVNAAGHWDNIKPFPYNSAGWSNAWPFISQDGKYLYFASDKPGGLGGFDLYYCTRQGNDWSEPVNLGSAVNTPGNEITPHLFNDRLYFASDWHMGIGGYDVFFTYGGPGHFKSVVNMGAPINTTMDDLGLLWTATGKGYILSNRHGRPDLDIYLINGPEKDLRVQVVNAVTGKNIERATIDFEPCGGKKYVTGALGTVAVDPGNNPSCKFNVSHPDYAPQSLDSRLLGLEGEITMVRLRPAAWTMPIIVMDETSQRRLEGARIRLTDQRTGFWQEFTSNENGELWASLSPQTIFFINIHKEGYQNFSKTIQTGQEPDKDLLGMIPMKSLDAALSSELPVSSAPAPAAAADQLTTTERETIVYAIQVGASKSSGNVDVRPYQALSGFGSIYQKISEDVTRIRVGLFENRQDAEKALTGIIALGYPDAYIVQEKAESLMDKVMMSIAHSDRKSTAAPPGKYLVRLAAYKNPQWFDPKGLNGFGVIQDEKSGEWTVMFIRGIATLNDARVAVQKAREAGFADAYILLEKDDNRIKID